MSIHKSSYSPETLSAPVTPVEDVLKAALIPPNPQ